MTKQAVLNNRASRGAWVNVTRGCQGSPSSSAVTGQSRLMSPLTGRPDSMIMRPDEVS